MRLYKMELFKLFQNKIFKIGMLAATGLLFLYFWFAEVGGEIATVDGKFYSGYEAVQMNRKITEEFEGNLTDKKVNQISPKLFEVAGDPFKMKDLEVDEIKYLIKEIGLANTKAKNLKRIKFFLR